MTLKEALLEELQKLRLNRERPQLKQAKKTQSAKSKSDKLLEEAKKLLEEVKD